jgi:opacity protein-like surface antigen
MKIKAIRAIFKLALLTLVLSFAAAELSAQVNTGDYTQILLKTGYAVRGKVVAFTPGETITLQTLDGSTITYATSEIETYGKGAKPTAGGSKPPVVQFNRDNFRIMAHLGFGTSGATKSDYDTKSVFKFPSLLGVGVKYNVDTMFSLHADLNYERKGHKMKNKSYDFRQSLNYLTLPLYIGLNFPYENLIVFAQAGPYVGLLLKEKIKDDNSSAWGYYYRSHRAFDYGFLLGVGVEIPFNDQISFRAGLRYTRGLHKISDYGKIKNRSFNAVGSLVYRL